jgi:arsenate reductase
MIKNKVLFLCVHNGARSQMAEAFLKKFGGNLFEVESAGLEPGILNPYAIEVMKEEGIDISNNQTKDVFSLHEEGRWYSHVITVCDAKNSERCPVFPGVKKISWEFDDPAVFMGTPEEKLAQTRVVRDEIKSAVLKLIQQTGTS